LHRLREPLYPVMEMRMRCYLSAVLVCTSIPVSRKKILTMAHLSAVFMQQEEGLVARTSAHAPDQTHSVSLL